MKVVVEQNDLIEVLLILMRSCVYDKNITDAIDRLEQVIKTATSFEVAIIEVRDQRP